MPAASVAVAVKLWLAFGKRAGRIAPGAAAVRRRRAEQRRAVEHLHRAVGRGRPGQGERVVIGDPVADSAAVGREPLIVGVPLPPPSTGQGGGIRSPGTSSPFTIVASAYIFPMSEMYVRINFLKQKGVELVCSDEIHICHGHVNIARTVCVNAQTEPADPSGLQNMTLLKVNVPL